MAGPRLVDKSHGRRRFGLLFQHQRRQAGRRGQALMDRKQASPIYNPQRDSSDQNQADDDFLGHGLSDGRMSTNKMWGGRFESGPAAIMREITPSIDFDKRLAAEDLAGSRAHCRMLANEGIISKDDGQAILDGLSRIEKEITDGSFVFKRELEDIHLNIEARLAELIGPAAGRLHTARS